MLREFEDVFQGIPGPPPIRPVAPQPINRKCFGWQQLGHVIKDCPQRQQARQGQSPPARAFAVMLGTDKVQGTFNLFQEPIRVLFYTGASHSFISR